MQKWIRVILPLIMIFILTSFRYNLTSTIEVPSALKVNEPTVVLYPKYETSYNPETVLPPYLGSTYIGFKEALAFKESQGNYFSVNTLGYLGKFQFGVTTLQLMGVYDTAGFLKTPALQEKLFDINIARNKWILRNDIKKYVGKRIKGIKITESGILASAHLAGAGNVKKYLRTYGGFEVKDAYGTAISSYMKKFSGYDVSDIKAKKNPRV